MDATAGVESIPIKIEAMQAKLVARALGNPDTIGDIFPEDFREEGGQQEAGGHWADLGPGW